VVPGELGTPIALNHVAVWLDLDRYGRTDDTELFEKLNVLFDFYHAAIREKQEHERAGTESPEETASTQYELEPWLSGVPDEQGE